MRAHSKYIRTGVALLLFGAGALLIAYVLRQIAAAVSLAQMLRQVSYTMEFVGGAWLVSGVVLVIGSLLLASMSRGRHRGPDIRVEDSPALAPFRLIEDEPVRDFRQDELQMVGFAQTVAEAALGTPGPFTIGVFGEWGTGKTSLLRQAKSLIDAQDRHNVVTVWFNAWQYEKEEHLIVPLLATVVQEIEEKTHGLADTMKKCWEELGTTWRAIAYGFSFSGFFSAKDAIEREEYSKNQKAFFDRNSLYFGAFEKLKALGRANASKRPANQAKIVVFVDDLDRCMPGNAIKLLEGIKLVLAQPGFVSALAVNPRIIEEYLTKRYREYGVQKKRIMERVARARDLEGRARERDGPHVVDELVFEEDDVSGHGFGPS